MATFEPPAASPGSNIYGGTRWVGSRPGKIKAGGGQYGGNQVKRLARPRSRVNVFFYKGNVHSLICKVD